jgi:arabinogalactan endo-1,4-beta-galactosidase
MMEKRCAELRSLPLALLMGLGVLCLLSCGGEGQTPAPSPPSPPPTPTPTQPPPQPVDITPINGEVYYVLNQYSGLQADPINDSTTAGDHVIQQERSFTRLSQRWAFTELSGGYRKINNVFNGFCLDSASSSGETWIVQNPCTGSTTQQWILTPTNNGYYTISNRSTGLLMDVYQASTSAGTWLNQSALSGSATQSQQWLLRPTFFRGADNALLEKQEAARVLKGLPWWKDADQQQDVLQILKNHGVNMIRLRPTSMPPYATQSAQPPCIENLCYAETEAQDLNLAKRARNLGMSIQLSLLFDGGSSSSIPAAWSGHSFGQLQSDLYDYVKQEIMLYRQAGVMPDMVSVGNEVDTGFLGTFGNPWTNFSSFAALQIQASNAVQAAAADTSVGPALPAPLFCIHITPAYNLTTFFQEANQAGIPYDVICQSYYPMYHGPLTAAQAAQSNPQNQPVEQFVLIDAANAVGKPIFIIETAEHYESGLLANDPWYAPPSKALQRQFLIDLQGVVRGLPNNLGMGIAYWNPAGVNIPSSAGGYINGDNLPDAIYRWDGLTLFDNADQSGRTNVNAPSYSALLSGIDALGGKLDPALSYKFVNRANGQILTVYQGSTSADAWLNTAVDDGNPSLSQQWRITSNNDGYFQIASLNPGDAGTTNVLDNSGGSTSSGSIIVQNPANGSEEQEWNIVSAGNGYFNIVNRLSSLVLDMNGGSGAQAGFAVQQPQNSSRATQQWRIVAAH